MKLKMKKIAFLLSIISIFLSSCGIVIAQSDEVLIEQLKQKPLKGIFGLSFTNSVPQNEFYDNLKKSGQGFSLYGGYNFTPVPVTVGLQTDFLFMVVMNVFLVIVIKAVGRIYAIQYRIKI